eukprot:g7143.t1
MEDVDALFGQAFASAPGAEQAELDWDIDVGDVPLYLSYGSTNMIMKARGQIAPVEGTGAAVKQRRALMKEVHGATRNGLPKQELTPELERELKFLQMRAYADPARFYKGNDTKELPTHFHLGVEVGGSGSMAPVKADGTASRNENKKRKGVSLMQEMLKDQRVQEWTRKRFDEVGAWGQEGSLVKKSGGKKNKGKNGWKNKKKR